MFQARLIIFSALFSFSALAGVSFEEKKNRVEFLEELGKNVQGMDIDAYRRELNYEKLDMSLDERAKSEAALIAEQIKTQIAKSYEAALSYKEVNEAAAEVRDAIERDSELMAPELREEVKAMSLKALEDIQRGEISSNDSLANLEKALLKNIKHRYEFLNEEGEEMPPQVEFNMNQNEGPRANSDKDAERKEYKSKAELMESLLSDRESVRWVSSGNLSMKTTVLKKIESNISLQVKAEFLGVSVSTGPNLSFRREYTTQAQIFAEGLNPMLLGDGNFDFYKRDRAGNIVKKGGKPVKRFLNFFCEAGLEFATEVSHGASLSIAGIGGGASVSSKYQNNVNLTSRRVLVPEYIDSKTATLKYLSQICHMDFLKARITNNMNVAGSLNMMMRNMVSSLRYSHPKTKCMQDSHCFNWYNKELGMVKINNYPRCVQNKQQNFNFCQLRGLKGQNCAVFTNGKKVSDGMFEYPCDAGLRCVKTQTEGWFQGFDLYRYAKGKCMPINAKTYRSPLAKKPQNKGYIEVHLVN